MIVSPRAAERRGEGPEYDLVMTVITPAHDNVSIHQLSFLCLTSLNAFYNKPPALLNTIMQVSVEREEEPQC